MSAASQNKQGQNKEFLAAQWKPGQSGNPAGRPTGSRSKLSENFLSSLQAAWERNGDSALDALATLQPLDFVEIVSKTAEPVLEQQPAHHGGPVFGLGDLLAAIATRTPAAALPHGSVRVIDARVEPSGRDEAVDSGPVPGG